MNNKKILTILFLSFLIIGILPLTSAWFARDHSRFVITGFEQISSPITDRCREHLNVVLSCEAGNDLGVLHYIGSQVSSYIFPHSKSGVEQAFIEGGTDDGLFCCAVGTALHDIADDDSHGENGFTTKYLKKFLGNNYIFHMITEKSMQDIDDKIYSESNQELETKVDAYDQVFLNDLFPELGGDQKYMELINDVAGMDMSNDARIFRSGYIGEGFYGTVYKQKVSIPFWAIIIPIILIILGLFIIVPILIFGVTNWKWLVVIFGLILILLGGFIGYTFLTGTTWKVTNILITVPASLGYGKVSQADAIYYNKLAQEETNNYLKTGDINLVPDDASGLSYTDRNGVWHDGALTKASQGSWFIVGLFIAFLFILLINIFFKSLVDKKQRTTTFKWINKILNWALLIIFSIGILLILYFAVRILFG